MLFREATFTDFGPLALAEEKVAPVCQVIESRRRGDLRRQVRLLCPAGPGVYGMVDGQGELIYVGKAKRLRVRLLSYFRARGRPRKAGRIVALTRRLVWERCPSEFAALLRELELIRRWRPRCNVQGQPLRSRKAYVCLGRHPAPYVFLTRRPPARTVFTCGPIVAGRQAANAVCRVNDLFGLRDCPQAQEMIFPEQGDLFHQERPAGCLRAEIGTCLAPCTGRCAKRTYMATVRAARGFMAGENLAPLQTIENAMNAAAQTQQFERAAALRDKLASLTWLTDRLERLRQARTRMSFVYPVAGNDGVTLWYVIHSARVVRILAAPRDAAGATLASQALREIYQKHCAALLASHEHVDGMALVMAWFRKHPKELKKTLTVEEAVTQARRVSEG